MNVLAVPSVDPTFTTALQSLDMGSVYSADGREHPVLGVTPISIMTQPTSTTTVDQSTVSPATGPNTPGSSQFASFDISSLWGFAQNKHIGARFVIGVLALIIFAIAISRILK